MDEQTKQRIRELGKIYKKQLFKIGEEQEIVGWYGPRFNDPPIYDTVEKYEARYVGTRRERRIARKDLAKYRKSSDDEVRILAIEELGPTGFQKIKFFVLNYPCFSAILFGSLTIAILNKLYQYAEALLK